MLVLALWALCAVSVLSQPQQQAQQVNDAVPHINNNLHPKHASSTAPIDAGAAYMHGKKTRHFFMNMIAFNLSREVHWLAHDDQGEFKLVCWGIFCARSEPKQTKVKFGIKSYFAFQGLQKTPEYNGMVGDVLRWDNERGKFVVRLDANESLFMVNPENLQKKVLVIVFCVGGEICLCFI
jgi:hypothetical protein